MTEVKPKQGDLRVYWIPQVPMKGFEVEVESVTEAVKIMDVLANYDLFQFENKVKPDYCNMGILQKYEEEEGEGEWLDWDLDVETTIRGVRYWESFDNAKDFIRFLEEVELTEQEIYEAIKGGE